MLLLETFKQARLNALTLCKVTVKLQGGSCVTSLLDVKVPILKTEPLRIPDPQCPKIYGGENGSVLSGGCLKNLPLGWLVGGNEFHHFL